MFSQTLIKLVYVFIYCSLSISMFVSVHTVLISHSCLMFDTYSWRMISSLRWNSMHIFAVSPLRWNSMQSFAVSTSPTRMWTRTYLVSVIKATSLLCHLDSSFNDIIVPLLGKMIMPSTYYKRRRRLCSAGRSSWRSSDISTCDNWLPFLSSMVTVSWLLPFPYFARRLGEC